jgi:Xaa-Pro aminopeptidase
MNKHIYNHRVEKLQNHMIEQNVDICLLMDRENLIYFAGIEQIECMTLVVPKQGQPIGTTLWLDVSFVKENSFVDDIRGYVMPNESVATKVTEIISEMGYDDPTIGFERYFVSFSFFSEMRNNFDTKKFIDFSLPIYMLRSVKEAFEIEFMREASNAVCEGMKAVIKAIKPGITELELAAEAEYASMKAGSQGAPFRPQIVTGKKMLSTHPFSNSDIISNNSVMIIHMGARVNGYIAKMCRTAVIGEVDQETLRIYEAIKNTQSTMLKELKSGVSCDYLSRLALDSMDEYGYKSKYLYIMGYGVGLRQSEFYPVISLGNPTLLEENMVVDFLMPTVYDKNYGGPRITDTILVKKDGCEVLTDYSREIIRVD